MSQPATLSPTCYASRGCTRPRQRYSAYCRECNGIPEALPRPCLKPLRCYCPTCSAEMRTRPFDPAGMGSTDLKTTRRLQAQVATERDAARARSEPPPGWRPPSRAGAAVTPLQRRPAAAFEAPGPSHAAANALTGLPAGRIRTAVLTEFARAGAAGATDDDVERTTGRPHQTVSSARNALVAAGYLTDTGRTRATRSGHAATVWRVSDAAEHIAATLVAQLTL